MPRSLWSRQRRCRNNVGGSNASIASLGLEFDHYWLRCPLGPVSDKTSGADIAILRATVAKPLGPETRGGKPHYAATSGSPSGWRTMATRPPPACTGSRPHSGAAGLLPVMEDGFPSVGPGGGLRVEAVDAPFVDSALPAYLHLPYGRLCR